MTVKSKPPWSRGKLSLRTVVVPSARAHLLALLF